MPGAISWSQIERRKPYPQNAKCEESTPALLTFTSGATGQPKAAVRTHGFLVAQHHVLEKSLRLMPGDVDLTTLPIVLLANLASGVTSLIPDCDLRHPGRIKAGPVCSQIQSQGAISSAASPAFFECVARHCLAIGIKLTSLQRIFTGGAPVFPRLLDEVQAIAPAADVVAVYGSTEAEPIAHVSRREIAAEDIAAMLQGSGLLAGVPVDELQLRIMRDQWGTPVGPYTATSFAERCLPPSEAGEIVVSGRHVLPGYLHGQGDEETKFRVDGAIWHRTGDAGYLDDRGRLWLLGRCAARIEDDRGMLFPFAAETAVYQNPDVRRAAVVAIEGRRCLALEYFDGRTQHDPSEIKHTLAWAKLDEVRIYPELPVDARHNAKIDYPRLREMLDQ